MRRIRLQKGDLLPALTATLREPDRTPANLNGRTPVTFTMRKSGTNTVVSGTATVTDATNGRVSYPWASGNTSVAGTWYGKFETADGTSYPNNGDDEGNGYIEIIISEDLSSLSGEDASDPADVAVAVVSPGTGKAAEIQDWWNDGYDVRLLQGTYTLETALLPVTGRDLIGAGEDKTILTPSFTNADQYDTATNALIKATPTLNTSVMNTTLASLAYKGATTITVTAAGTIAPGHYVLISGRNVSSNGAGDVVPDGANVIQYGVYKVASVASTTITLTSPLLQYHAAGMTVVACTPIRDVTLQGFKISASSGTLAVGILFRSCLDVSVSRVNGIGLSRALVEFDQGTTHWTAERVHSEGECNSIVYFDSAHEFDIRQITSARDGARNHGSGVPRALINCINRCTSGRISDCRLEHANIGMRLWGGVNIQVSDITIRDMDNSAAYTAGVTAGEVSSNEVLGVGIDGDSGPTAWNQWLRGSSFTNITIEDCAGNTGDEKRPGWWLHDCEDVQITNLTISNRGRGPTVSGATGLTLNTCDVRINGYRAIGVQYAIYTKGTPNAYLKNVTLNGETGDGTSAGNFAMYLNHGSAGSNVEIDGLQFDNYNLLVWFGTDFTTAALYNTVKFTDVRSTAGRRYPLLIPARNASGVNYAGGDIVEIDQTPTVTGAREIITPSAANTRNAVVHLSPSDALTGWMMICPLPSTGPCTVRGSGTIEPGDLLVADSNRRAVVSASPAAYTCLGKAISRLASGTGDVEIVPA